MLQWKVSTYEKYTIIKRQKWKYNDFASAIKLHT